MAVKTYDQYFIHVLRALSDGGVHSMNEIRDRVATETGISEEDLAIRIPSGTSTMFSGRIGWAKTYLAKAGLIKKEARGRYCITDRGLKALESGKAVDLDYLCQFPEFTEFFKRKPSKTTSVEDDAGDSQATPEESLQLSLEAMQSDLEDSLLERIDAMTPAAFEVLVVELLRRMYGGKFERNAETTGGPGDNGIDGIVKQDRLGFNNIYIQAKKWSDAVSRPDVQKFAGALQGQNASYGAFITSSDFTKGAREFAEKVGQSTHIALIGGRELVRLMIEFNLGVVVRRRFEIKGIDTAFFESE